MCIVYVCENMQWHFSTSEPPTGLIIENIDKDSILNALEGNDLILDCSVISGRPKESLVWVHEGIKLLESTSGIARYTISLSKIDHLSQYTCKAISPALTIALSKTVTIKVHCKYYINFLVFFIFYCYACVPFPLF